MKNSNSRIPPSPNPNPNPRPPVPPFWLWQATFYWEQRRLRGCLTNWKTRLQLRQNKENHHDPLNFQLVSKPLPFSPLLEPPTTTVRFPSEDDSHSVSGASMVSSGLLLLPPSSLATSSVLFGSPLVVKSPPPACFPFRVDLCVMALLVIVETGAS